MAYTTGGTGTAFGGTGILFCTDAFKMFPASDSVHAYDVVGLAGQMDHLSGAVRGEDYMNWVFDNYYARIFLTANGDTNGAGYGFNSALWEIRHDYDGTQASLSTTTGSIYAYTTPSYVEIVNGLKTADIAQGYRSKQYTLTFLNDQNNTYQSMVLLSDASGAAAAAANAVPEPSSLALSLMGGLALWNRRRSRLQSAA
ncbi:PEP-CTERM sorting domain-containing protein [Rhodoferax sp. WC2427]|uniref:PEP-CTERM sorting domain-containing protein n=1 Tax=Rhodoferax sp. WC2427 TaxID=3234144 RepID=UPI003466B961